MLYPEDQRLPVDVVLASQEFRAVAAVLDRHMKGRPFIVGDDISVADCVTAYLIDWANEQHLIGDCPQLSAYLERMYTRPAALPRIATAFASL